MRTGEPARLRLGVFNENGGASQASAISSITLTTTLGKVRAGSTAGGGQFCAGSSTCSVTISALAAAAATTPSLVGAIWVDLYDVDRAGSATVSATIVSSEAAVANPVFRAEPLTVAYSGNAASLSFSAELQRVNAYGTPDATVEADPDATPPVSAATKDDRDVIRIKIGAVDARGVAARVPQVLDPGGGAVAAGRVRAVLDEESCNTGRLECEVVIEVDAPRGDPLASGIYTLRATSGTIRAETTFGVAGDPGAEGITIELEEPGAVGSRFEGAITVVDAAGEPVADGTEVSISVEGRGGRTAVAVQRAVSRGWVSLGRAGPGQVGLGERRSIRRGLG